MSFSLPSWLQDPLVKRLITVAVSVLFLMLIGRWLRDRIAARIESTDVRYRARKAMSAGLWIVTFLISLSVFSDHLGGLAVSLGVAGAGIAFALQEVIASVAGRIAVLFGGFYSVGDRVQLGGIKGDVIDIGTLRTTIMEIGDWVGGDLYTGRVVRVANSFVFKEPVYNYSGDFNFLWDEIRVPVKYGSDRKLTRELLTAAATEVAGEFGEKARSDWDKMANRYRLEDARVEPWVSLVANDNWLEYTVRYVVPVTRRRTTKDELFERILDGIDTTKGKIALASATFQLVETPTFDVRLVAGSSVAPAHDEAPKNPIES